MNLEFIVRKVKQGTKIDINLKITKNERPNAFIVVGEENLKGYGDCYKVEYIGYELNLIPGVNIAEQAYTCLKSEIEEVSSCFKTAELDIPKEYLTLDIVDDILRLNRQYD